MPTDRDIPVYPELAPDTAVGEPESVPASDHPDTTAAAAQPDGETLLREWEGLPPDSKILFPVFHPAPMRTPDHVWALRVDAVSIVGDEDPDQRGAVDVFAGSWISQTPASALYDGDLVLRLTEPTTPAAGEDMVDVEMLLAHHGQWQHVGRWRGVDDTWPHLVAATANVVMDLHTELAEASIRGDDGTGSADSPPASNSSRGGLAGLIEAGLVTPGDEFVWDRCHHGARHIARVHTDGTLVLANGRVCATPTAATTALGGIHHNGWKAFARVSDGRTLADLRTETHPQRAN